MKLVDSPTFVQPMRPYRHIFIGIIFALFGTMLSAQQLTGIWKGYFITKDQSQYKIEVQINQKNSQLTGVTYSYLDVRFYGKATMTGSFDKKLGKISMQEIKTVEVKSSDSSETCIMNYQLAYSRSGSEEYLEGDYSSKYENNGLENKKGADCGGGIVFLRRVSSSDFDTKPNTTAPAVAKKIYYNQAPPTSKAAASTKPNPSTKTIAAGKPAVINKGTIPNKSTPINKTSTVAKPVSNKPVRTGTSPAQQTPTVKTSPTTAVTKQMLQKKEESASQEKVTSLEIPLDREESIAPVAPKPTPESVANSRQNELVKEIAVTARQLSIFVYDNGEIDGDTVSVYLNGKVILSKKRLSTIPLQLKLALDEEQDLQELTFVAENLGRIPPNTALMIVDTGQQQYRLQVLSTDKKNAVFRFRFQLNR